MNVALNFNDADIPSGDVLTYSIRYSNGLSVGSWVSLNSNTGALVLNPGLANVGWTYF